MAKVSATRNGRHNRAAALLLSYTTPVKARKVVVVGVLSRKYMSA